MLAFMYNDPHDYDAKEDEDGQQESTKALENTDIDKQGKIRFPTPD